MRKIIYLLLLGLFQSNSYAWDSTAAKFYPLAVGNVWSYHYRSLGPWSCSLVNSQNDYIIRITGDTLMPNGKKYYKFTDYTLLRIDSNSMNVYKYISIFGECLLDSLLAMKSNYYNGCTYGPFVVSDTNLVYFAGAMRRTKGINALSYSRRLMFGIGFFQDAYCELYQGNDRLLNGCIINGIQYGTIVGIEQVSNEVPNQFSLSQNYPNPFNPGTIIRFNIKNSRLTDGQARFATLRVFDILGREIETLVNEQLQPGTYEVKWNATNYPSGIYYYTLSASASTSLSTTYNETKKMVLIK